MANPFQVISDDVFASLQRDEQVGFGSYAIFGEQPSFYSNPDIWRDTTGDAEKGEVAQASGNKWVERGNLLDISGLTTLGTITVQATLPSSPSNHDILVVTASGQLQLDGSSGVQIDKDSVLQYVEASTLWRLRGNLTDFDGISTIGTAAAQIAASLPATTDNNVIIFTGAVSSIADYGLTVLTEWLYPTVFEFVSSNIVNESTPIIPERISPTRSPIKNQDGQVMVSGDFNMHVHVEDMLLFWKYILMDDEPTCVAVTPADIPDNLKDPDKTYYRTTFKNRDETLHGLTAEIRKGTTSNVYMGLNIASATLTFAENIDMALTVMGLRGYLRQGLSIADASVNRPTKIDSEGTVDFDDVLEAKPIVDADVGKFKRLHEDTYKGWGCAVRLYNNSDIQDSSGNLLTDEDELRTAKNEKIVPVTDVTLTINHNLEHTPRYWGSRFPRRPIPTAKREITLDCTTDYTEDAIQDGDFAQDFFENRVWDHAELLIIHQPFYESGKQETYQTLVSLGRGQLTTYSDPEVAEQGPLTQTINFKSLPRTAGASDELEVEVVSPENLSFIVKTRAELEENPVDRTEGTIGLTSIGSGYLDATTS